jgi:hypothetical protein
MNHAHQHTLTPPSEAAIAAVSTAPRVTPADIEAQIAYEGHFTADMGIAADNSCYGNLGDPGPKELKQVSICVLVLKNGHKIVGVNEGPVSPENFDAELGRKMARGKAIDQIWPLMGYQLKEQLYQRTQPAVAPE